MIEFCGHAVSGEYFLEGSKVMTYFIVNLPLPQTMLVLARSNALLYPELLPTVTVYSAVFLFNTSTTCTLNVCRSLGKGTARMRVGRVAYLGEVRPGS